MYTSANNANKPKAPCTSIANGPRRRHSPFSGDGCTDVDVEDARTEEKVEDGMLTAMLRKEEVVAIAAEVMVGAASWRSEVGSKPGGGCIS